jgi:hypothetical protein
MQRSFEDCPCNFWREKCQTDNAGNMGPAKTLVAGDVADSTCLATDEAAEPFVSPRERFGEIRVGLGGCGLLLIQSNELGFDASPPKPNRNFNRDCGMMLRPRF